MNFAVIRIIGIILFLYLMWRNLRENYKDEDVIAFSWLGLLGFFVGGRLIFGLTHWGIWNDNFWDWVAVWNKPGMDYLGGYLSMLLVGFLVCRSNDWKVWQFAEDAIGNLLILMIFMMLDEFVRSRFDMMAGIYSLVLVVGYILSNLIRKKYRSFLWYRSGKKGFVFLFTNFILCLMLAGISFWLSNNVLAAVLYLFGGLISLSGLFILGESFELLLVNMRKKKYEKSKAN